MATVTRFPSAPQLPQKPTPTSYENACRATFAENSFARCYYNTTIDIELARLDNIFNMQKSGAHCTCLCLWDPPNARGPEIPQTRPKTLASEVASTSPLYVILHAASGAALASLYALFLGTHVQGLKFSLFTGSHRHPYSLNERHLVLLIGNVILGVVYATCDAICHRDPAWLRRFGGLTQRRSTATWKAVIRSSKFAVYYWPSFLISYLVLRVPCWAITNRLFGFVLSPFLHFILRSNAVWQLVSWSLFWRMFVLQITTLVMWDVAGEWFEINASQVIHLSQFKEDPNASLIAGLQSKDTYYKYFAFAELANVVATRAPRRVTLFSDLKANPTAWEQVCRECLLFLGKDYSAVVNRNAAPPAGKYNVIPVYKSGAPPQTTPIDAFVGAANTVATVIPSNLSVPAIFLSASHSVTPTTAPPLQSASPAWKLPKIDLSGVSVRLMDTLPPVWAERLGWIWNVLFVERQEAQLEALLQGRAADIWVIEALSTLVASSLQEDPYGRVQRDIPRVLEALVAYLGALEQLVDEMNVEPTPYTEDAIKRVVQPVADALREGIRTIVLEFGHRLAAFTFPPRVAKRLQTMVDYL
ncbi:Nucleoporin [Ceratobasidium theobromae]|uniref:Nucleoporin n=1 Tax=Ceratobasidium theobromae TaxID=1582974 RepID=A0A5N5QLP9_9AGAM|nr:Nucleoporin [Ceratobasidium theobromae]